MPRIILYINERETGMLARTSLRGSQHIMFFKYKVENFKPCIR